jgi:hypothetical protein
MKTIIENLVSNRKHYRGITQFSDQPGIYALFFTGKSFPLKNCQPKSDEVIYIGKTESSQKSRDRDTHFKTGKTGSSTLRRSFGAMLREELNLMPIPRNDSDFKKGRTSHFKFDQASEEKLTEWMQDNLALSFYPFSKLLKEIDELESQLISALVPLLNIDRKNSANPHKLAIQGLRKESSIVAHMQPTPESSKELLHKGRVLKSREDGFNSPSSNIHLMEVHKYEDIFSPLITVITLAIMNNSSYSKELDEASFNKVGNRKSYSFRLELVNGRVANNIAGSAVARDLARVLESNSTFSKAINGKTVIFKMSKQFYFKMEVAGE